MTSEERREQRYQRRKAARLKKRQETIGKYDDFERVASLNSLYEAAREASKGVDWKASVQRYNSLLLFNISKTRAELLAGKDIRRGFICFDICERGILLIDFSDYFGNVAHEPLFEIYRQIFTDPRVIALGMSFISAFGDKGLGLGSETSQINAVMLPNRADHYAKEVLRIRGYGRYMDDTYLLHHSIAYLEECLEKLRAIYSEYGIVINEKKTKIVDLKHGFTFLKTHFYITETGRIIKKPCRDSITRERRKLKKQADLVASGVLTFDEVRHSYASWRGSMSHRDAYRTVQSMDRLFNRLFIDQWKGGPQP